MRHHDPTALNWLETTGWYDGSFLVGWQKLPQPLTPAAAIVCDVKGVKLAEPVTARPSETRKGSGEGRRANRRASEEP
jgi:hypothetical protein